MKDAHYNEMLFVVDFDETKLGAIDKMTFEEYLRALNRKLKESRTKPKPK